MKAYADSISERLQDQSKWPGAIDLSTFNELQTKAATSVEAGGVQASLAAILLMHQLAEEMIFSLLDDAVFYMQLKLYPLPYKPERPKRVMFGRALKELESTVWFQNKKYICERARLLNEIRIPVVHGLTKPGAIHTVEEKAKRAWEIYSGFAWLAFEAHLVFQSHFGDFLTDENWPPPDTVLLREDGSVLQ
jgi:hypothetical protein